ncbi:MAG TPA: hypothetical protein VF762_17305 [Blastocatellia bacterium]
MTANLESGASQSRVAEAHHKAKVIVLLLAASIVVYTVAGLLLVNARQPRLISSDVPVPFYVAALFLALGSIALRRAQMRRLRLEVVAGLRGIGGLINHFLQVAVVSAALAEVIGVLALAVVFFGGDQAAVIRLGVVALVVALFAYPRRSAWQRAVDYYAATIPGVTETR